MSNYQAVAKRWYGGWELHIPGVGVTQTPNLAQAEKWAKIYIAKKHDADQATIRVTILPDIDSTKQVTQAKAAQAEARRLTQEAAAMSREAVANLRKEGLTFTDIACIFGVSKGRISQLAGIPPKIVRKASSGNTNNDRA